MRGGGGLSGVTHTDLKRGDLVVFLSNWLARMSSMSKLIGINSTGRPGADVVLVRSNR
jgi:hypothetical protein